MSDKTSPFAAYEIVLADLRAKRDQLDQAIRAIESAMGGVPAASLKNEPLSSAPTSGPGDFLGMSIPDAARALLASRRRAMNNAEIAAALKAGGLAMTSADPANTIGSALTRRFHQIGDVVRVERGTWGLQEWYPNRNFKKKTNGDPIAPGQPSAQPEIAPQASSETPEPGRPSDRPSDLG